MSCTSFLSLLLISLFFSSEFMDNIKLWTWLLNLHWAEQVRWRILIATCSKIISFSCAFTPLRRLDPRPHDLRNGPYWIARGYPPPQTYTIPLYSGILVGTYRSLIKPIPIPLSERFQQTIINSSEIPLANAITRILCRCSSYFSIPLTHRHRSGTPEAGGAAN